MAKNQAQIAREQLAAAIMKAWDVPEDVGPDKLHKAANAMATHLIHEVAKQGYYLNISPRRSKIVSWRQEPAHTGKPRRNRQDPRAEIDRVFGRLNKRNQSKALASAAV